MQISIVGLPKSGKTTVFNAVTRGHDEVSSYPSPQRKPNIGVAKVPDGRLSALEAIFKPKRKVQAEVSYMDIPVAPEGHGRTLGVAGENLEHVQRADALLVVARAFDDPAVPHVDDTIDPYRDVEAMLLELNFADLEILERRLARLAEGSKGAKAPEREALAREQATLETMKANLEAGTAIRDQSVTQDEARMLEGFQLLTAKPLLMVVNASEAQMPEAAALEARLSSASAGPRVRAAVLCGKLEMELAQMDPAEELEFRESLGAGESGLERMIGLSHQLADLVTFFTGNANEVRAWTVPRGTTALKAAGKVHSDMERGFIRAEVIALKDLADIGGTAEARKRGLLRQEGKEYVVNEGDVLNILFSV